MIAVSFAVGSSCASSVGIVSVCLGNACEFGGGVAQFVDLIYFLIQKVFLLSLFSVNGNKYYYMMEKQSKNKKLSLSGILRQSIPSRADIYIEQQFPYNVIKSMQIQNQKQKQLEEESKNYIFHWSGCDPQSLVMLRKYQHIKERLNLNRLLIFMETDNYKPGDIPKDLQQHSRIKCTVCHIENCQEVIDILRDYENHPKIIYVVCFWPPETERMRQLLSPGFPDVKYITLWALAGQIIINQKSIHIYDDAGMAELQEEIKPELTMVQQIKIYTKLKQLYGGEDHQTFKRFSPLSCQPNRLKSILTAMANQKVSYHQSIKQLYNLAQKFMSSGQVINLKQFEIESFFQMHGKTWPSAKRILKEYTNDSFFHKLLNNMLRCAESSLELFYFDPSLKNLYQAILSIYNERQKVNFCFEPFTCYRGAQLAPQQIEIIKNNVGKYIITNGFLSSSMEQDLAMNFMKNAFIIIEVDPMSKIKPEWDYGYAQIQNFSEHQYQAEVLFNFLSCFKIEEVQFIQSKEDKDSYYQITLSYGFKIEDYQQENCHLKDEIIQIQCQGDTICLPGQTHNERQLIEACVYWKKVYLMLNILSRNDKKIIYQKIITFQKIAELEMKLKRFQELRSDLKLITEMLKQLHLNDCQLSEQKFLKKVQSLATSNEQKAVKIINEYVNSILSIVFSKEIKQNQEFVQKFANFLKQNNRNQESNKFKQEMEVYFQTLSNNLACFKIEDLFVFVSMPNQPQSLVMLKNLKVVKQEIFKTFYENSIAYLNHQEKDLQDVCNISLSESKIFKFKNLKQLEQGYQKKRFSTISCITVQSFISIIQSRIMKEPGELKVICFLESTSGKKLQEKVLIKANYMEKQIIMVAEKNFNLPHNLVQFKRFLVENEKILIDQAFIHFQLSLESMAKQNTDTMTIFEEFSKVVKFYSNKGNQEQHQQKKHQGNENEIQDLFEVFRAERYSFTKEPALSFFQSNPFLEKGCDVLNLNENSTLLMYPQHFMRNLSQQISEKSLKNDQVSEDTISIAKRININSFQFERITSRVGCFVQNKGILNLENNENESGLLLIIKIPKQRQRKRLKRIGNFVVKKIGYEYSAIFNPLCIFEIQDVKFEDFQEKMILKYINPENFYLIPKELQEGIFLFQSLSQRYQQRMQKGLEYARTRNTTIQGQIYQNLIPDSYSKTVLRQGLKYWEHMYDLCWFEWQENKRNQKLKNLILRSINAEMELSMKCSYNCNETYKKAGKLIQRIGLTYQVLRIISNNYVEVYDQAVHHQRQSQIQFLQKTGQFVLLCSELKHYLNHQFSQIKSLDQFAMDFVKNLQWVFEKSKKLTSNIKNELEAKFHLTISRFLRDWTLRDSNQDREVVKVQKLLVIHDLYAIGERIMVEKSRQNDEYPSFFQEQEQNYSHTHMDPLPPFLQLSDFCDEECCPNTELLSTQSSDNGPLVKYNFIRETIDCLHLQLASSIMDAIRFTYNLNQFKFKRDDYENRRFVEAQMASKNNQNVEKRKRKDSVSTTISQSTTISEKTANSQSTAITQSRMRQMSQIKINSSSINENDTKALSFEDQFQIEFSIPQWSQPQMLQVMNQKIPNNNIIEEQPEKEEEAHEEHLQQLENNQTQLIKSYKKIYTIWSYLYYRFDQVYGVRKPLTFKPQIEIFQQIQIPEKNNTFESYFSQVENGLNLMALFMRSLLNSEAPLSKQRQEYLYFIIYHLEDTNLQCQTWRESDFKEQPQFINEHLNRIVQEIFTFREFSRQQQGKAFIN